MCHELMAHPLFFEKQLIKNLRYLEQFYDMQLKSLLKIVKQD